MRIGEPLYELEESPSTNDALWALVEQGLPAGGAVRADYQSKGRGQAGASWESEAGANLLCSFYLRSDFLSAHEQFKLNIAVSLALSDFGLLYLGEPVRVKWPNDLYYKDHKWGGILIENTIQGSYMSETVVGIGLNINQPYFPPALQHATSFFKITGQYYKLPALLQMLFELLQERIDELRAGRSVQQRATYFSRLLGLGEERSFEYQNQLIQAKIIDVDLEGRLVLESPLGRMVMNNKEIKFRF